MPEFPIGERADLGISVSDAVKTKEIFGKVGDPLDNQLKGIGGTLHVTDEKDIDVVGRVAWNLSIQTQKPVVVVFRSPRTV